MAKKRRDEPRSESFDGQVGNYGYIVNSDRIAPMANGRINFAASVVRVVRYEPAPTQDVQGYPVHEFWGETAWEAAKKAIDEIESWLKTQP